ncbi:hypothetical protein GIB67_040248 [Kingdonia uniflora]|uniref:Ethylene insensitive 3-like DNA-binding domain-containing protein n=1 Tax=Kingdonia uniflora TaxID=39325 RepID=A0A7J7MV70_9MAGN|nr:hypothetical protein GIB67_040248 [Kingdonia uniflora]
MDLDVDDILVEKDVSDEEIESEELERRMWKDRIKLKRIKEKQKFEAEQAAEKLKPKQTSDQARRKKMSRVQDGILKYMLKLMEVCNARGFVYGIIPEKGKPVSGASDNIRAWWKEKVKFDKNGPAAISNSDNGASGITETPPSRNRAEKGVTYSSDSDYDVDGVEDGAGAVSSKDDSVEPRGVRPNDTRKIPHNNYQVEEQPISKRMRTGSKESKNNLPDMNVLDQQLVEYQMNATNHENGPDLSLVPFENNLVVPPQFQESGLQNFPALPPPNIASTQSMFVDGGSLLYPAKQDMNLNPGVNYNFHNPSRLEMTMADPQMRRADSGVHAPMLYGNASDMALGEMHHFQNEQDRPITSHLGSPIDGLSLDFTVFDSSFNFTFDGATSLDDLEFSTDEDLIEYFGA